MLCKVEIINLVFNGESCLQDDSFQRTRTSITSVVYIFYPLPYYPPTQVQKPASITIHKRDIVIPPQENPFLNIWNKTTNENKQYDKNPLKTIPQSCRIQYLPLKAFPPGTEHAFADL